MPTATSSACSGRSTSNLGAYTASFVPLTKGTQLMTSLYRMPAVAQARGVLSNTPSTAPYRSAGRPETMFVIERLIDMAARAHGFDRVELRRRNLITTTPHTNAFGVTYDSGDYAGDARPGAEARRLGRLRGAARRRAARGLRRGLGLGGYVESQSGAPQRARRGHGAAGRHGRDRDRHAVVGPGPRHQLRPARQRMAGRAGRQGAPRHRRQRPPARWAAARIPAARCGWPRRRSTRPSHGIIAKGRKLAAQQLEAERSRHRLRRRPLHGERHRPRRRPVWSWRPSTGRSPTQAMSTAGSAPIPTAGMSARSRSMPRPAWRGSTATPRSTMSAAR